MSDKNPFKMDERLETIFNELENEAYDKVYHNYDYKMANKVIRRNFDKLISAQTIGQAETHSYSEPVPQGGAVADLPGEIYIPRKIILELLPKTSHLRNKLKNIKGVWAKLYLEKGKEYRIGYTNMFVYHFLCATDINFDEACSMLLTKLKELNLIATASL